MAVKPHLRRVQKHPAETAMPIATILATLIANVFDVTNTDTILYIGMILSFTPAAVTWFVETMRDPREPHDRRSSDPPPPPG